MASDPAARGPIVGVLLAGGLARRMGGGDKCLRELAGRPLLDHVIARVAPQVDRLVLNANGDPHRFASYGLPVASDVIEGFAGPLAGVLTGMVWARAQAPGVRRILTVPTDAPFLPADLVVRLAQAVAGDETAIACAASGGRTHPVVALWPVALADDLRRALVDEGLRRIDVWTARHRLHVVEWPDQPIDPFFNANRAGDLAAAERLLQAQGGRAP